VPVTLELGGKDPFIIFSDADFEQAATICMRAVYWNCGQNCISAERIYVEDSIHDRFVEWVTPRVRALRQGNAIEKTCDVGAFGIPQQCDIVDALVTDARKRGAKVVVGGKRKAAAPEGSRFYEPTLLTDVSHDMDIIKKECFGPVMSVLRFKTEEELIRCINSSEFALGASVFTTDYAKADRITRAIHSGMVSVNEWGIGALVTSLPFGGSKVRVYRIRFYSPEI
jgi:acyl-CoA reductase-like NAD-dependent aldehyde dehydrogenase